MSPDKPACEDCIAQRYREIGGDLFVPENSSGLGHPEPTFPAVTGAAASSHLRDARHQTHAGGQLFQLQPRPQIGNGIISTGSAGDLPYLYPRLAQWEPGLHLGAGALGRIDVVLDPTVEPAFAIVRLHEAADLVAAYEFEVMREPACCHQIRQSRRNRGIGSGFGPVVFFWLLYALRAKEHRIVGVLVVADRQKAEI